jgi:hypothetical protein
MQFSSSYRRGCPTLALLWLRTKLKQTTFFAPTATPRMRFERHRRSLEPAYILKCGAIDLLRQGAQATISIGTFR